MTLKRLSVFLLTTFLLIPIACTKSDNPTAPPPQSAAPTNTFTFTPSPSSTNAGWCGGSAGTCTLTNTFTESPSSTTTSTPTETFTLTSTSTSTYTSTETLTFTPTSTRTYTMTPTDTMTNTETFTPTDTPTPTETATLTETPTITNTGECGSSFGTCTFTSTFTLSPTVTATSTHTPSPTMTSTPAIEWMSGGLSHYAGLDGYESTYVGVALRVNGLPESTAGVTVIGSNGTTVAIPYGAPTNNNAAGVTFAHYWNSTDFVYMPGVTYTLSTDTSMGSAQAVITTPGGMTYEPVGRVVTWSEEGNLDSVLVLDEGFITKFQTTPGDVDSPVTIPSSAFSSCGKNVIALYARNQTTVITGATMSAPDTIWGTGLIGAQESSYAAVTITTPCTPAVTATPPQPMDTATWTYTPMETRTPTWTSTRTSTPTDTRTPTPTDTRTYTMTSTETYIPTATPTAIVVTGSVNYTPGGVGSGNPINLTLANFSLGRMATTSVATNGGSFSLTLPYPGPYILLTSYDATGVVSLGEEHAVGDPATIYNSASCDLTNAAAMAVTAPVDIGVLNFDDTMRIYGVAGVLHYNGSVIPASQSVSCGTNYQVITAQLYEDALYTQKMLTNHDYSGNNHHNYHLSDLKNLCSSRTVYVRAWAHLGDCSGSDACKDIPCAGQPYFEGSFTTSTVSNQDIVFDDSNLWP